MFIMFDNSVNRVFISWFEEHFYKVLHQSCVIISKPSKAEITSWSAVFFIFKALTSQEEVLLGKPWDLKAFHRPLVLPRDSVNLFPKKCSFFVKNHFLYFISFRIINILSIFNIDF